MPVLLTERERDIFLKAKEFSVRYLAPEAAQWEADRKLPDKVRKLLQDHGFFGVGAPVEVGGKGCNYLETALTYEGLAYGDGGVAFFIQLHNNIAFEIATFYDTTDKVKALTPDMIKGNKLTCFALTEKSGGSDPTMTEASAELKEDGYHVFGHKDWASDSLDADYFTVIVKDGTAKGMVMLLLEKGMPGFTIAEDRQRIGGNAMSCGTLHFDDVVVPRENLLSVDGFKEALKAIDVARVFVPAIAVGVAQRALDITADHLARRVTFGQPILKNQAVQWQLAELTALVQAARWTVYHTASLKDSGERVSTQAAVNKLFVPNAVLKVTLECAQLFGAEGCAWNSEITRCVNLARIFKVVDGTIEVQKIVIARGIEKDAFARIAQ
ncbi:MAG: acyl-CoA/acyl-ACP dehydrogenase [Synergistaceae bacterium]|jgi:butyryl-CoA dehydrogenase|nr:acyl-CoA/acyl-ACP dehydrogenase [Synergistaceae bacterium]